MTSKTIDARWVRLLWSLPAFVPLVVFFTPGLAYHIGYVWLLCAMYLWPATGLASLVGLERLGLGWPYVAIATSYCFIVAAVVDLIASRVFKLRGGVSGRFAVAVISIVWMLIVAFLGHQILEYKGLLARTISCPGQLQLLAPHCGEVMDLRVYALSGFIDTWYLARYRTRPGALAALAARGELAEVDSRSVPESIWKQPPVWWDPSRDDRTHVYATASFPYEGRGSDGDHYLFIENGRTNDVYVFFKSNF